MQITKAERIEIFKTTKPTNRIESLTILDWLLECCAQATSKPLGLPAT